MVFRSKQQSNCRKPHGTHTLFEAHKPCSIIFADTDVVSHKALQGNDKHQVESCGAEGEGLG